MSQQVVEMTSDEAKLLAGIQRVIDKQIKLQDKLRQTGEESKKTSEKVTEQAKGQDDTFSAGITSLGQMALGYVSLNTLITMAVKLLNEQREASEAAGRALRQSEFKQAQLVQLVTGATPEERAANFKQLTDTSESMHAAGVGRSVDEAADVLFNLMSAGVGDELDTFTDLAATGVGGDAASVADLAKGVATLVTTLGQDETGSARSLVGKALAAAEIAPGTVSQVMSAAARGGGTAKALGLSDEELLAATALVSASTGSTEMGGTQVASLLKSLDKKGEFQGKSLADSVAAIDAMNLSGEQLFEYLGTSEAVGAYRTLSSNRAQYDETLAKVNAAATGDRVGEAIAALESDPEIASARAARIAEANLAVGERGTGVIENEADAAQATIVDWTRRGAGEGTMFQRFLGGFMGRNIDTQMSTYRWLLGNEPVLGAVNPALPETQRARLDRLNGETAQASGTGTTIAAPPPLTPAEQAAYLKRIADSNDAMARGNNAAAANAQAGRHIE